MRARRAADQARLSDFARAVALRELHKREGVIEDIEDPGLLEDPEYLMQVYLPYRDKGLLPEAGGTGDQDPATMHGIDLLNLMVAWWIQEMERGGKRPDAAQGGDFDLGFGE
ncbi:MAG: hypothetical protein OHK0046_46060 [Anaerolineae bacterium]